jgi:hypothetical protein
MKEVKRNLSFSAALYEKLQRIAEKERRSIASQILKMLEDAVMQYEQKEREEVEQSGKGTPALLAA